MTRADLESLIDRIAQSASEASSSVAFYETVAGELTAGLECEAVTIWRVNGQSQTEPIVRRPATSSVGSPESNAVASKAARDGSVATSVIGGRNGKQLLRVATPVRLDDRVPMVIEAHRSLAVQPALDANQLAGVLEVIAELAASLERRLSLADAGHQLSWHQQLEQFVLAIHGSLDPEGTAHEITNEGRRLIGCDRLTVLERKGRAYRVVAVSGQHEVQRRSNAVRALEKLTATAMDFERQMSHPATGNDLPPQLETAIDEYCDASAATQMEIVSLADDIESNGNVFGAIVAENFAEANDSSELGIRTEAVARHAAQAWQRAREHRSVFLLPLWAAIGNLVPRSATAWVGWAVAAIVLLVAIVAMLTVQTDFHVVAEGTLQPAVRSHLFATSNGVIDELSATQGLSVATGQTLVVIENPDLALEMEALGGELQTTSKKLASVKIARLSEESSQQVDAARLNQLAAEEAELEVWLASLERQQALLNKRHEQLTLASPIDGTVITWNIEEQLDGRPVREGQRLMTIAQLDDAWTLELDLPAARAGHVATAAAASEQPLLVSFVLATDPETSYTGTVLRMSDVAEPNDQSEPIVRMVIAVDANSLPDRRPGALATAKINCGRRSLADVWFRDFIEFVQRKVLFRIT